MYRAISVAVDNSHASGHAEDPAVQIARATGGPVTGLHVYTGHFHRSRFQALEVHLPEQYQEQRALDYQRATHSVLIERGLELISLEYMKRLKDRCDKVGIPFSEMITDGKNSDEIIGATHRFDLMVMGSDGLGRQNGAPGLGSNTRRVLRYGSSDLLVAKKGGSIQTILAGVDGSEEAFRMIEKAAALARALRASLTITASFDPGLHRSVFGSLSGVLSARAGNTFRFSEQENLHNTVIDTGLSRLYTSYLGRAAEIARQQGSCATTVLLQGKPYLAICAEAEAAAADLVIVGRHGMHRGAFGDIGSNAERIAEHAGTNVLIVNSHPQGPAAESDDARITQQAGALPKKIWGNEARAGPHPDAGFCQIPGQFRYGGFAWRITRQLSSQIR